jgi:hypothetical protein
MGAKQSPHTTAGGSGALTVIRRTGPQQPYPRLQLPADVPGDPICALAALLAAGLSPREVWPACSTGLETLLHRANPPRHNQPLPPAWSDSYPTDLRRLQEVVRRHWNHEAAPRTAIRAHRGLTGLISEAQVVVCTPEWFLNPSTAAIVCATPDEAAALNLLLRRDYNRGRDEDLFASAQWVAENLMPPFPGWRYDGPGPVLLAEHVPPDAQWQELFLSPGCQMLPADQLLPAVRAARVGLHLVAASTAH